MKKGNRPEREREEKRMHRRWGWSWRSDLQQDFSAERGEKVKQREQGDRFKEMTLNRLGGWGRMQPWESEVAGVRGSLTRQGLSAHQRKFCSLCGDQASPQLGTCGTWRKRGVCASQDMAPDRWWPNSDVFLPWSKHLLVTKGTWAKPWMKLVFLFWSVTSGALLMLERLPFPGLAYKACLSYANQWIPSPHPTPPPLSSSHTLGHCSSAPTNPAPGTRQPQMAPTPQRLMRLFTFAPPKPVDPALPSPPIETTVKTSAHIYYSLSLPLTDAGVSSPRGPMVRQFPSFWGLYLLLLLFNGLATSDSLQPHGLQHARLPCPSLSPGVCSNSCPLSQ